MQKEFQIQVYPEVAADEDLLKKAVSKKTRISSSEIRHIEILKRSIDARQSKVKFNLKVKIFIDEDFIEIPVRLPEYPDVSKASEIYIVGAGPAGLFAALRCIELGTKPVIIERGKDVHSRGKDLKTLYIDHFVNEDSNFCFGEGGAGTYSDGKLYTRSKKRGNVDRILHILCGFGADKKILIDAHPHIGTNKLPGIIARIRRHIIHCGGEIRFNSRVSDLILKSNKIIGLKSLNGEVFNTSKVILATGHSARDIYYLLYRKGIAIEAKPFALGVRVEHPQELIDKIQYKCEVRSPFLPASPYNIARQVNKRGVYSFCMCPGGVVAPCATSPGEVVTNGWSPSGRDLPTATSGIVVELNMEDFKDYTGHGPLAALEFQKTIEQKAWNEAGRSQRVPAQRLADFVNGIHSDEIGKTSYKPGVTSVELRSVLPDFIYETLQEGFRLFNKSMKGFITNEAVVHAPESRTSSPVRIPRNKDTMQHISIEGLYPCGEGAGYAGGIISSAIDGERCAEKCVASPV